MNTTQYDVTIVGGGMVGAATAIALARENVKVALVELKPQNNPVHPVGADLRVSAIIPGTVRFLSTIDIWNQLDSAYLGRFSRMRVWDALGRGEIEFNSTDLGQAELGYLLENQRLLTTMYQAISASDNITPYYGVPPDRLTVTEKQASLILDDGQVITSQLVIGADGQQSWVREAASLSAERRPYHHHALVANVITEQTHAQTALQCFLPDGPLAFLPMANPYQSSIVWSNTPEQIEALMALDSAKFKQTLAQAFEQRLGAVLQTSQRLSFPLNRLQAKQYVAPRVALVGDAAHVIHPLAGQGVNLGFLDGACLAKVLGQSHHKRRDLGALDTLRRYERARKGHNQAMLLLMDGFKSVFTSRSQTLINLRSKGLSLTHRLPYLKQRMVRYAMYELAD